MKRTKVVVQQSQEPDEVIERNVLATSIVEISKAIGRLQKGGINMKAIEVLTWHNCKCSTSGGHYGQKPSQTEVRAVLQSLRELESEYCK